MPKEKYIVSIWNGYQDCDDDWYTEQLEYNNVEDFKNDTGSYDVFGEWLNMNDENLLNKNVIVKLFICTE